MIKTVFKLDLHDDKAKGKAMKDVCGFEEIDFIGMDMKEKKMTVIGSVNPLKVLIKLRKFWPADIVSLGPVKAEEAKKEETNEPQQQMRAASVNPYAAYNLERIEENPNPCAIM
ncbi:unnamed protein product [Musa acuminata subsp. malaccensis]|uniref:(wild Malaysian banana) hypothetical protein n=1 Tax=Musa acuminata subsp. malaccensis TaxID=214687 RepID=A0A804L9R5_MUSAM|nr:PREDICTED: uncharacterized protein LOC103972049 [Musa acuminata subsp. malaccensis]CAG1865107.1 unnamed protein product [Musa acuminata subsp. malaccensis]